mmetsp:Transcript_8539/g.25664  ORF Transcript_8539/g.25664 Transcript_8539/m.25664 type:complete len:105 (-) Transcript_8539:269-583(-)
MGALQVSCSPANGLQKMTGARAKEEEEEKEGTFCMSADCVDCQTLLEAVFYDAVLDGSEFNRRQRRRMTVRRERCGRRLQRHPAPRKTASLTSEASDGRRGGGR